MANLLKTIIENDRGEIKRLEKMADKVFSYEDQMAALTDDELKAKAKLRKRSISGSSNVKVEYWLKSRRGAMLLIRVGNEKA